MRAIHYSWVGLLYVSPQLIYRHNTAVNVTVVLSQRAPSEHFSFCSGFHRQNVETHLAHLRLLVMVTGSDWKVSLAQRSHFESCRHDPTIVTRPWARDKVRPSAATEPLPGTWNMRVKSGGWVYYHCSRLHTWNCWGKSSSYDHFRRPPHHHSCIVVNCLRPTSDAAPACNAEHGWDPEISRNGDVGWCPGMARQKWTIWWYLMARHEQICCPPGTQTLSTSHNEMDLLMIWM